MACSIILPVLIIPNSTLWVMDYNLNGEAIGDISEVDSCDFYFGNKISIKDLFSFDYTFSHLTIFTETGFEHFINNLSKDDRLFDNIFHEKRNDIINSEKASPI
ncbi:MAG: hypothetical protein IPL26_10495 [Leptospiraceae bacterium]|nr:hypothetical protein [Leptospiraceae bacterium]